MAGIIVDCVDEVIRAPMDDIDLPPAAARLDTTYITGICKYNLRLITLLDIDKVLTQDEVKDLKKVDG